MHNSTAGLADVLVFAAFFSGVAICFMLSAAYAAIDGQACRIALIRLRYHTVSSHSSHAASLGNQLDYLGIIVLMWGATTPTIYYAFYGSPRLQLLYFTMVCRWSRSSDEALECTSVDS